MNFGDLLNQAKEAGGSFTVLPAARYLSKCIESEYKSSAAGKPQIKTRWEVIEGPHTGEKGLFNHFTLTTDNPKAVIMFMKHMRALGFDDEFFGQMAGYSPEDVVKRIASMLEGRTAILDVKIDDKYDGTPRNNVNAILPAGPGVQAPSADPFVQAQASAPLQDSSLTTQSSTPTAPPPSPF